MDFNEQLFREEIAKKESLNKKLSQLQLQREDLQCHVDKLKKIMYNEQADVESLEHTNLKSIFYGMIGKRQEKLDKEKLEAYTAKLKYDSAVYELKVLEQDIINIKAQLDKISEYEYKYSEFLKEKVEKIKLSGSFEALEIMKLEEQIANKKNYKKELNEAILAGEKALISANNVLSSLDSAEDWGTFDLFGGGVISDMVKHNHLDEAQNKVEQLQSDLRRFKTELTDVTINSDIKVNIDGFLRFADYFFDSFFTDWAVLDKINESQENVKNTKRQIEEVISRLHSMENETDTQIKILEADKEQRIVNIKL